MGAASMSVSCICASLSLPWPVRRPAVALGRFLTLDLVVRCSSTSGAEIEFWCPGTLCWSPVPSTLRRLENLSVFLGLEVMDPVFFLPLLVAPSLEAPQRGPARFCGWLLSLWPLG